MPSIIDLIYRTTDNAKWGAGKGTPLVASEVDGNFWAIVQKIFELESNPTQPLQIESIEVVDNNMVITMSDLSTVFTFPIPVAAFRWMNEWQPDTDYQRYDFLTVNDDVNDGVYLVLQAHTSAGTFDPEASNISGPLYQLIMPFANAYDFGFFFPGKPGTGIEENSSMFVHVPTRAIHLPADLEGSVACLNAAPDDDLSFPIYINDEEVGSIDFAAGDPDGTFTFEQARQLSPEFLDRLKVLRPDTIDATALELAVTFKARLGGLTDS